MEAVLQWGLDFIRFVQSYANPPLTMFFRIITELGSPAVYLILLPLVYWCIDEKKGLHLGVTILISAWVNIMLKFVLDQPRPFFPGYDPDLGMIAEKMGGFPSGHAQNSLVLWIIIASWGKKKCFFGLAGFFCLLIGFSRVYLGVHFPTDIFGGWLLGGIILCIYFLAGRRIEALLAVGGPRAGMLASAALAFIMILYRPLTEMLIPGGLILGLGTGYFLCKSRIGFSACVNQKIESIESESNESADIHDRSKRNCYLILLARFVIGMAVLVLLFIASGKAIAIFNDSGNYQLIVFLRYALIAFWVSAGAPWIFRFLRII